MVLQAKSQAPATKSTVYLETTIFSYLTARPTRDIVQAAHQQLTREWWDRRTRFDLFVSQIVITEASGGDADAASKRLAELEGIPVLAVTSEAVDLAGRFVKAHAMPERAAVDALHVAVAVVNGMDYVLTWNCTHIANAAIRDKIEQTCRDAGYEPPVICTPEELMG
jgi:predicted nucleic acid-binding protein